MDNAIFQKLHQIIRFLKDDQYELWLAKFHFIIAFDIKSGKLFGQLNMADNKMQKSYALFNFHLSFLTGKEN